MTHMTQTKLALLEKNVNCFSNMCKTWGTIRIRINIKMESGIRIRIGIKNEANPQYCSLYVIHIPQCS
jgi:hypothetical protein